MDYTVNLSRREDGSATLELDAGALHEMLTGIALSIAAYGVLQNFMTLPQKTMTLPSIVFFSKLGALLAEGEQFDGEQSDRAQPAPPDSTNGHDA